MISGMMLTGDIDIINERLRQRPSLLEFFGIAFNISLILLMIAQSSIRPGIDFEVYLTATEGGFIRLNYFYAYWLLPVFKLLSLLEFNLALTLWTTANVLGIWFAGRVFGGRSGLALLTYQMFYVVFYGQIIGVIVAGLALLWWGLCSRRWHIAGLGLILACTKYQAGFPLGLALWLLADITWRERIRVLIVPTVITVISLILYPLWPLGIIASYNQRAVINHANITLWRYIGPLSLILWLPVLIVPMTRAKRIILVAATASLALPYFQNADLLALFVLPIGWVAILGNVGFLFLSFEWVALQILFIIPLIIYLDILISSIYAYFLTQKSTTKD